MGWFVVSIENPENAEQVAKTIDTRFANSAFETLTETEQVFQSGFVKQLGNIKLILIMICSVVFFTLLLVTSSTMAMVIEVMAIS